MWESSSVTYRCLRFIQVSYAITTGCHGKTLDAEHILLPLTGHMDRVQVISTLYKPSPKNDIQ